MGWIEGLNDAMDYIEANLEGDLDLAHAARLAACTEGQFRRMFSYIAGIGLGEYVRRRRISRAALVDWQHLFGRFREGQPRFPELDRRHVAQRRVDPEVVVPVHVVRELGP